jgi:hypothetical protein
MKKKLIIASMAAALMISFVPTAPAKALSLWDDQYSVPEIGFTSLNDIGYGRRDPRTIVAGVIQVLMGFLGVLAVILILVGGFKWMTANGNDAKIKEAQKLMQAGVIGLLIILSAFGISLYIVRVLLGATGANSTTTYQNE